MSHAKPLPTSPYQKIALELLRRWNEVTGVEHPFPKWPAEPMPASEFLLTNLSILTLAELSATQQYVLGRAGMFRAFMEFRPLATIGDIDPAFVAGYIEFRRNRSYHPKGLTVQPLTICRELTDLRRFIRKAYKRGALKEYVTYKIAKVNDRRDADLSDRAVYFLLLAAEKLPVAIRTYIFIALYTGQRNGAIMELDWEQVDWERNTIEFNKPNESESNKQRAIVRMAKPLGEFLLARKRLSSGTGRIILQDRSYINQRHPWVQMAIDEAAVLAAASIDLSTTEEDREANRLAAEELEKATPHHLRHKMVSKLIEAGVSARDVGDFIGHGNKSSTQRYIHLAVKKIAECPLTLERLYQAAVERLNEALRPEST